MVPAVPFLLMAIVCTTLFADDGPGWLLVVLWAGWNSMKFIIMGPVSPVPIRRIGEAVARCRD